MAAFLSDTFTEAGSTALQSHTPEVGGSWTKHSSYSGGAFTVGAGNGLVTSVDAATLYYNDATPPGADYVVSGYIVANTTSAKYAGVAARISSSADTYYQTFLWGPGTLFLSKYVSGVLTHLQSTAVSVTNGAQYELKLTVNGTSISAQLVGVTTLSATDSSISAAGFAGVLATLGSLSSVTADQIATSRVNRSLLLNVG